MASEDRYFVIQDGYGPGHYFVAEFLPVKAVKRSPYQYFGGFVKDGPTLTKEEVFSMTEVLGLILLEGGNGRATLHPADLFLSREAAEERVKQMEKEYKKV